jgi:hypothetical protein
MTHSMGIMGSVVLRNMKRSPFFFLAGTQPPVLPGGLTIDSGETIVGVYQNPEPWASWRIVFSDIGMYVATKDDVTKIRWDEILDYETISPAEQTDGIRLRTRTGIRFVRIGGSYGPSGQFKDAFNLAMILHSAIGR